MSYLNQTVQRTFETSSSIENNTSFMNAVAEAIAETDDKISALSGEIGINFNNKFDVVFTVTSGNTISIAVRYGGTSWSMTYSVITILATTVYSLNFHVAVKGDTMCLKLRGATTGDMPFDYDFFFSTVDNVDLFAAGRKTSNGVPTTRNFALDSTIYNASTNVAEIKTVNRLPYLYSSDSTQFERMDGKILIIGNRRAYTSEDIFDCSFLTGDQIYPVGGKNYYALNEYTLIEV